MKRIEKVILVLGGAAGLHWLITTLHSMATLERGYDAFGGEFLLLLVPVLIYYVYRNAKDMFDELKTEKSNEDKPR